MVKIYKFALFLYLNYIKEDWSTCTKFGKIVTYPFWWIRSLCVWLFFFIFLPAYWYEGSKLQKDINMSIEEMHKQNAKHGRSN
jgi:hypothetical protein